MVLIKLELFMLPIINIKVKEIMHTKNHNTQEPLKAALLATGLVALAAGGVAWFLSDERNKEKARELGQNLLEKGKEYVNHFQQKHEDKQKLS